MSMGNDDGKVMARTSRLPLSQDLSVPRRFSPHSNVPTPGTPLLLGPHDHAALDPYPVSTVTFAICPELFLLSPSILGEL